MAPSSMEGLTGSYLTFHVPRLPRRKPVLNRWHPVLRGEKATDRFGLGDYGGKRSRSIEGFSRQLGNRVQVLHRLSLGTIGG